MADNNRPLSPLYDEALSYAADLHRNHFRKQGPESTGPAVPYLSHLLQVSGIVLEYGGDEEQAIAALLHDAIEDAERCGRDEAEVRGEIESRFGERVYRMVEGCTDTEPGASKESIAPDDKLEEWRQRKTGYLGRLPAKPRDTLMVSMADKLHNSRAIVGDYTQVGEALWDRFTPGGEDTVWYYESLVSAYEQAWAGDREPALLEALRGTVGQMRRMVPEEADRL